MTIPLFVYGTLLAGEANHGALCGARLLGRAHTVPRFCLVDLGEYPGLVTGGREAVVGERYAVSTTTLCALDELEGHPNFYRRSWIDLQDGSRATSYLLLPEHAAGRRRIASGDWKRRDAGGRPSRAPW